MRKTLFSFFEIRGGCWASVQISKRFGPLFCLACVPAPWQQSNPGPSLGASTSVRYCVSPQRAWPRLWSRGVHAASALVVLPGPFRATRAFFFGKTFSIRRECRGVGHFPARDFVWPSSPVIKASNGLWPCRRTDRLPSFWP